jgi:hypothetical protein
MFHWTLGMLVGLFLAYSYYSWNHGTHMADVLKSLSPLVILLSVILASRQFVYNGDWNKKDAAIKAIYTSREKTGKYNRSLNKILKTSYKFEHNESLTIAEIHNYMGVFLVDQTFIFHEKKSVQDKSLIHNDTSCSYLREFKNNDGTKVSKYITLILNEYEYISMACMRDIFDKKVIMELRGDSFIKTYNLFINYIYHCRYDQRHNGGDSVYEYFEYFVKEIDSSNRFENIKMKEAPRFIDYLVPFGAPIR